MSTIFTLSDFESVTFDSFLLPLRQNIYQISEEVDPLSFQARTLTFQQEPDLNTFSVHLRRI